MHTGGMKRILEMRSPRILSKNYPENALFIPVGIDLILKLKQKDFFIALLI